MRSASYSSSADPTRLPLRRRAVALALTIAAHLLIVFLLLRLSPTFVPVGPSGTSLTTFDVAPGPQAVAKAEKAKAAAKAAPKKSPEKPVAKPVVELPPPPPVEAPATLKLFGDKALFEAADIGRIRSSAPDTGEGAETGDSKGDSVAAYGPGAGPGGKQLFNAEWVREPTRAEIAGYLPPNGAPEGWAMIACQTVPDFRVENCRELGESPMGSKLARTLRQAAWQFRVRPPRVGGKAMIGAWVRIRFDWTTGSVH